MLPPVSFMFKGPSIVKILKWPMSYIKGINVLSSFHRLINMGQVVKFTRTKSIINTLLGVVVAFCRMFEKFSRTDRSTLGNSFPISTGTFTKLKFLEINLLLL